MPVRLTARSRLTLLYTGLVLAAGVVLTALTYLLMRQNLAHRTTVLQYDVLGTSGPPPPLPPNPSERLRTEALTSMLTQAGIALAATINGMLDRIQRGIAERDQALGSQRLFTANAAHELRTPLTTIRTAIDVTLDGEPTRTELLAMAEDVRTAADDSRRTIDGLLALARSQAEVGNPRPVDLAAIAAAALADVAGRLSAADLRVDQDLRASPVLGEPVLLERMAANLIGNAIRYNHPGGRITVATGTSAHGAILRVHNTGRMVPADQVDSLLEPFVRGEGTRTPADGGAGLGLSIVRAVVLAHHGEITATARPSGGLDITVRLQSTLDDRRTRSG